MKFTSNQQHLIGKAVFGLSLISAATSFYVDSPIPVDCKVAPENLAQRGSQCYEEISALASHGVFNQLAIAGDWYPGLSIQSSFAEFQMWLYKKNGLCHNPTNCEVDGVSKCRAKPGTQCFKDVVWAMQTGINNPVTRVAFPNLHAKSTFEEFQDHFYKTEGADKCPPSQCPYKYSEQDTCKKITTGDCKKAILNAMFNDIHVHPDYFPPTLNAKSTYEDFQSYYFGEGVCAFPAKCFEDNCQSTTDCAEGTCQLVTVGKCYDEIMLAKKNLDSIGLPKESTFADIQLHFHQRGICPFPVGCGVTGEPCEVVTQGDCYDEIAKAKYYIHDHPQWYPGMSKNNTDLEWQFYLHKNPKKDEAKCDKIIQCPLPGNNCVLPQQNKCSKVKTGEKCYKDVEWAKNTGLHENHPYFPKELTVTSRFEDFQNWLWSEGKCDKPAECWDGCHLVTVGGCYDAIKFAQENIHANPNTYDGMSPNDSFAKWQSYFHYKKSTEVNCPKPIGCEL
eukprot:Pgem_evm1s11007